MAAKKSAKKAHKKEMRRKHREEEKSKRKSDARRQNIIVGAALVGIVGLVIFVVIQTVNPANQPGTAVRSLGNEHISSIDQPHAPYNTVPPTSGPHLGGLANWGITENQVPDESQIHNLEDGGVILQYDCPDDCPELKDELTAFANEVLGNISIAGPSGEVHFILGPHTGIREASGGSPIALTAWGRYQYFDALDHEEMMTFISTYINRDHHVR